MHWRLDEKNAIVFGASKGIGRAAARSLAERGAQVTVAARSEKLLKDLVAELDQINGLHNGLITIDVMDQDSLKDQLESLTQDRIYHILINNTGGPSPGPIHSAEPEDLITAFRQHIIASQIITTAMIAGMKKAQFGRIINVISTSVKEPIPGLGVSNTIRGAMGNWAKTMAGELAPFGITVNNVLPGFTSTSRLDQIIARKAKNSNTTHDEMAELMKSYVPTGRFADPDELGRAITFLAMPAASYITGINLPVDGGRTKSL